MLSLLLERLKNSNLLVKSVLIALIFFYFAEDWSFTRLITFILLLLGIFLFFNRDILKTSMLIKADKDVKNVEYISNQFINNKNNKKYHPDRQQYQNIEVDNIIQNSNLLETKPLANHTKKLIDYTYRMKNLINKGDPSYAKLIDELVMLTKEYIYQINLLLEHTDTNNYPHLLYRKVQDCQKEISIQMQSLHFKVGVDQYAELEMLIDDFETQTELIIDKLIDYINDKFNNAPNSQLSPVPKRGEPRAFDDVQDIDAYTL